VNRSALSVVQFLTWDLGELPDFGLFSVGCEGFIKKAIFLYHEMLVCYGKGEICQFSFITENELAFECSPFHSLMIY